METYTIVRDGDMDLRFNGEMLASVKSSERFGRWTELCLYRTQGGRYVCVQHKHSKVEGEKTRTKGIACEKNEEIIAFFGAGWLAKDLYRAAGIEAVVIVE